MMDARGTTKGPITCSRTCDKSPCSICLVAVEARRLERRAAGVCAALVQVRSAPHRRCCTFAGRSRLAGRSSGAHFRTIPAGAHTAASGTVSFPAGGIYQLLACTVSRRTYARRARERRYPCAPPARIPRARVGGRRRFKWAANCEPRER